MTKENLEQGSSAPDFTLIDQNEKKVSLSDFKGQNVVLYFYPKDDTSGCTKQACSFRDGLDQFKKLKTTVLGVSFDDAQKHQKFIAKYDLNFSLLCDTEKKVAELYDVYKEKSMYGRKYWGIERSTFLIDAQGKIVKIWRKVKVPGHSEEVLAALKNI